MSIFDRIKALVAPVFDASGPWRPDLNHPSASRGTPPAPSPVLGIIDLQRPAAAQRYGSGRLKRTRFPAVDLSTRQVVIVLHQAGVERSDEAWRKSAHRVTCHYAVGPSGVVFRVHPPPTRLVAANRVDRYPWHAISIEVLANLEGVAGSGKWWMPAKYGRGQLGDLQIQGCRLAIMTACDDIRAAGGEVFGILPHRTTGRDSVGRPNRPICPGSAVWSHCGEWAGAALGLRVPGPGWCLGGMSVPQTWHGPWWEHCTRYL
jgi:hypothetical protein